MNLFQHVERVVELHQIVGHHLILAPMQHVCNDPSFAKLAQFRDGEER